MPCCPRYTILLQMRQAQGAGGQRYHVGLGQTMSRDADGLKAAKASPSPNKEQMLLPAASRKSREKTRLIVLPASSFRCRATLCLAKMVFEAAGRGGTAVVTRTLIFLFTPPPPLELKYICTSISSGNLSPERHYCVFKHFLYA